MEDNLQDYIDALIVNEVDNIIMDDNLENYIVYL